MSGFRGPRRSRRSRRRLMIRAAGRVLIVVLLGLAVFLAWRNWPP
jgi:hypothetical protein